MTRLSDPLSPYTSVSFLRRASRRPVDITERVVGCKITHSAKGSTNKLEVDLDNQDQALFSEADLMRKGTILQCVFGYPGNTTSTGNMTIKVHKPSRTSLSIESHESKRAKMLRRTASRTFENARRSDVVQVIAIEEGFDGFIGLPTDEVLPSVTQHRDETNWQFLQRLARLENRELFIAADGLHWEKPNRKANPSRALQYNTAGAIGPGAILDWNIDSMETGVPGRVVIAGFDPLSGKEFEVVAGEDVTDIEALSDAEIFDLLDGDEEASGNVGREVSLNVGALTARDAKRLADSQYKKLRYGAAKMDLTIIGDPTVKSRQIMLVQGIGLAVDGRWWVDEAEHTFGTGFTSALKLTRDGFNKRRGSKTAKSGKNAPKSIASVDHTSYAQGVVATYNARIRKR